jgi:hypothetical protein
MKPQIKYGIALAVINFLWILIIYILGLSHSFTGLMLVFLSLIFAIIICVLSIKEQRTLLGGFISYGSAFKVGFITIFISGVIGIGSQYIYTKFIDTTYLEYVSREIPIKFAEKFGAPEETLDQMREKLEQTPIQSYDLWYITKGIMGSAFFSALISLIIAAIMKKPNPNPFEEVKSAN